MSEQLGSEPEAKPQEDTTAAHNSQTTENKSRWSSNSFWGYLTERRRIRERNRIRHKVAEWTDQLRRLPVFSHEEKQRLRIDLLPHIITLERYEARERIVGKWFELFIAVWFLLFGVKLYPELREHDTLFWAAGVLFFVITLPTTLAGVTTNRYYPTRKFVVGWVAAALLLSACIGAMAILLGTSEVLQGSFGGKMWDFGLVLLQAVIANTAFILLLIATATLYLQVSSIAERIHHPETIVVTKQLTILSRLTDYPWRWNDFSEKRILLNDLERIATSIEHGFPRRLRSGDLGTTVQLNSQFVEMAAAVRDLKYWVSTPRDDTKERFIERLASDFTMATSGQWDLLPRVQPTKLTRSQRLTRSLSLLRTILVAALPIAALVIIQQTSMAIKGNSADYFTIGALVWAALTLITQIDPLVTSKLEIIKEAMNLLKPGSSGKEE